MSSSTIQSTSRAAPYITEPNPNDVLYDRGASVDRFEGNIMCQSLINARKSEYRLASQHHEMTKIAKEVVQRVGARQGRFLRKIETLVEAHHHGVPLGVQAWLPLEETVVLENIKQALRDNSMQSPSSRTQAMALGRSTEESTSAYDDWAQFRPQDPLQQAIAGLLRGPAAALNCNTQQVRLLGSQVDTRNRDTQQARRALALLGSHVASQNGDAQQSQQALLLAGLDGGQVASHSHDAQQPQNSPLLLSYTPPRSVALLSQLQQSTRASDSLQQQIALLREREVRPPRSAVAAPVRDGPLAVWWWGEIPGAYQDLLPIINDPSGPPFTGKDLLTLLQAQTWAESARDLARLGQIQMVFEAVLQGHQKHQLGPGALQRLEAALQSIRVAMSVEPQFLLAAQPRAVALRSTAASLHGVQLLASVASHGESWPAPLSIPISTEREYATLQARRKRSSSDCDEKVAHRASSRAKDDSSGEKRSRNKPP
jgi:hypothetical protein